MMKNTSRLVCAIALAFLLTACSGESANKGGIAVVDVAAVQTTSTLVAKVSDHLESLRGSLMAEALEAEKAFKENESDESRESYLAAVDRFEKTVGAEEQRVFGLLTEGIGNVLEEYRNSHGIQAILLKDTVLSFDESLNITSDITAALDKLELNLTLPDTATPDATPEAVAPEEGTTEEKPAE